MVQVFHTANDNTMTMTNFFQNTDNLNVNAERVLCNLEKLFLGVSSELCGVGFLCTVVLLDWCLGQKHAPHTSLQNTFIKKYNQIL